MGSVDVTGRNWADDENPIVSVMPMPVALILVIKCKLSMVPMMETLTVFVDHVVILVGLVVPMVALHHDVSLSCGRCCRHGKGQRESAQNRKFRWEFSAGGMPCGKSTAAGFIVPPCVTWVHNGQETWRL
jgi:hypothetical protein